VPAQELSLAKDALLSHEILTRCPAPTGVGGFKQLHTAYLHSLAATLADVPRPNQPSSASSYLVTRPRHGFRVIQQVTLGLCGVLDILNSLWNKKLPHQTKATPGDWASCSAPIARCIWQSQWADRGFSAASDLSIVSGLGAWTSEPTWRWSFLWSTCATWPKRLKAVLDFWCVAMLGRRLN